MDNNNLENTTNMVVTNEPKKKGNKGIVIILILVILGIGGYFTYDKVLKDKLFTKEEPKKTEKKEEEKETKKDYQKIVDDYFKKRMSNSNYIETLVNYKLKSFNEIKSNNEYTYTKDKDYDIYLNGNKHTINVYYTDEDDTEECRENHDPYICVRHKVILFDNKGYENYEDLFYTVYGKEFDVYKEVISNSKVIKDNNGKEYYALVMNYGNNGYIKQELAIIDENGIMLFYNQNGGTYIDKNGNTLEQKVSGDNFNLYIQEDENDSSSGAIEVTGKVVDGKVKLEYSKIITNGEWAGQV